MPGWLTWCHDLRLLLSCQGLCFWWCLWAAFGEQGTVLKSHESCVLNWYIWSYSSSWNDFISSFCDLYHDHWDAWFWFLDLRDTNIDQTFFWFWNFYSFIFILDSFPWWICLVHWSLSCGLDILCYSTKSSCTKLFSLNLNDSYLNRRLFCPQQGFAHFSIS